MVYILLHTKFVSVFPTFSNILDNDAVYDLITKKKITANAAAYPDGKKHAETGLVLPGLQVVSISSDREFEDALTLCILNGKIKY